MPGLEKLIATGLFLGLLLPQGLLADPSDGERIFRKCRSCHSVGTSAGNRTGPHLNGLFDRKAASVGDYRYSKAMRAAAADGLEWNDETFSEFVRKPSRFLRGTRMRFNGLRDAKEIADLSAYLRTFSVSGERWPNGNPVRNEPIPAANGK